MVNGIILNYLSDKKFGFIKGENGKEYFFHISSMVRGNVPVKDASVLFKDRPSKKKPGEYEAYDVSLVGSASSSVPSVKMPSHLPVTFPYEFVERKGGKQPTEAFHHQLDKNRMDVAFEVTWTTETPTALMPCEDPSLPASAVNRDGENIGYNKRWLMIDGRPAISPFTVKGAVAGGIANLLGACYRVPDREEGHNSSMNAGTYPYTGKWKRYRVSMSKSLPGIIRELDLTSGRVKVQPVVEYYLEEDTLPPGLISGQRVQAAWSHPVNQRTKKEVKNKRFITSGSVTILTDGAKSGKDKTELIYHGPYQFGMNLTLKPGDLGKKHHHRFYEMKDDEISGTVPTLAFASREKLLKKVYGGEFCKNDIKELKSNDPRRDMLGKPWYDELASLKPGDWCYCTVYNDESGKKQISAIGKNFQFKALFNHEDVIPSGNTTCTDINTLCPRCSLFGLADKSEGGNKDAVGYAGRFRGSTLIAGFTVTEKPKSIKDSIPAKEVRHPQSVLFSSWHNGDEVVARQYALPIMGTPKPSKRDVNGYFDEGTGAIKGAKRYHHTELDFAKKLPDLISRTNQPQKVEGDMDYGHQMRPVAVVFKEGVEFKGTIGGENCSHEEVAALLMVLNKQSAGHAFKIGLGKSLGMGSVSSRISKMWIRKSDSYKWVPISIPDESDHKTLVETLKPIIPETVKHVTLLIQTKEILDKIHAFEGKGKKQSLSFPKPGLKYWTEASVKTIGK
ncbi:MAG: hypothetical protein J0665_18235 [Deltaproteobacteria bacterium]|nr:hypothetical protein [Deltaproteobacteria bacterium]